MKRHSSSRALCSLLLGSSLCLTPAAQAVNEFWVGFGTTSLWSDNGNWADNSAPFPGSLASLTFQDTVRLTPFNDLVGYEAGPTNGVAIAFSATAGAFILGGNSITLSGNVVNSSANLQTINLPMQLSADRTFTTLAGGGNLQIGGPLTGSFAAVKNGTGTLTFTTGTSSIAALTVTGTNSTVAISSGALNVAGSVEVALASGATSDAPVASLEVNGTGVLRAGTINVGDAPIAGTVSGTMTVTGNATVQVDNLTVGRSSIVSGAAQGTVNQTGGTLTVANAPNTGSQSGLLLGGRVTGSGIAFYNLDGGTLVTPGISANTTGAATFNFNGGTVRAGAGNAAFMPASNILTANVRAGGAKIDTNGFNVTITENLQHDPALGGALDGGLVKSGSGTLTLNAAGGNSYTGATFVNGGILAATADLQLGVGAGADVTVNDGAQLTLSGGTTSNYIDNLSDLVLNGTGKANLTFSGTDTINQLFFGSAPQAVGTWGSTASAATFKDDAHFSGPGMLNVTAVPEPGTIGLAIAGSLLLIRLRRLRLRP